MSLWVGLDRQMFTTTEGKSDVLVSGEPVPDATTFQASYEVSLEGPLMYYYVMGASHFLELESVGM